MKLETTYQRDRVTDVENSDSVFSFTSASHFQDYTQPKQWVARNNVATLPNIFQKVMNVGMSRIEGDSKYIFILCTHVTAK